MATITAKFAGQCKACGGSFVAGATIEWTKASGSKHVKCPESKVAAKAAVTIMIRQDWRGLPKPPVDSEVGTTFRVSTQESREHAGKVVTALTQTRLYQSDEDNEDMGDCQGGGWFVTLGCRLATTEEVAKFEAEEKAEREEKAAAAAKVAAEKAAKLAEIEAAKAKFAELTTGMEKTESYDRSVLVSEGWSGSPVVQWSEGGQHKVAVYQATAVTGETVFVANSYDYDDSRSALYAPRPVVEAAWAALATNVGETPEKAKEFLDKYSQCVGADWRRWLVEQAGA